MNCSLCGLGRPLSKSHIIPEFIYSPLYDEKHRFHILSTLKARPRPTEQKGIREDLLCADCERQISRYERYARGVLFGGVEIIATRNDENIEIYNIDYKLFKLFQLSLLWRANVASHRMFSRVNLRRHESAIREMIQRDNPRSYDKYGCILFGLAGDTGAEFGFIDQPTRVRLESHWCYRFIFGGLVWVFFVSSHQPNQYLRSHFLQESGYLRIWVKPFADLAYLREFAVDLHKMGRLRKPG